MGHPRGPWMNIKNDLSEILCNNIPLKVVIVIKAMTWHVGTSIDVISINKKDML